MILIPLLNLILRYPWSMNNLKCSISARLYDHHGKLLRKYRPKAAHSFLAQFLELLKVQMSTTAEIITTITDTEQSVTTNASNLQVPAGASNLLQGMLIGSGSDPVTIDDYKLQSKITTDLTASVVSFSLSYPTANTRRLSISRTFTNGSINPMAIEEVALYTYSHTAVYICLDRTLYSVSIPAESSLTLTYRIDVSV